MNSPTASGDADAGEGPFGWASEKTIWGRIAEFSGSSVGWVAFGFARMGFFSLSERLADHAIILRREGRGAIRAIRLNAAAAGRLAGRRGRLLIHGRMRDFGPFAGLNFYATYDVAAFNRERALDLVRRFEPDALPSSLEIEDGQLDHDDPGAEGVLWIARGKTFYVEEEAGRPAH